MTFYHFLEIFKFQKYRIPISVSKTIHQILTLVPIRINTLCDRIFTMQLKLRNIRVKFPANFQNRACCEEYWRVINTPVSSARVFPLGHYLSLKLTASFLELRSRKTVHFSEHTMSADKYLIIFALNGGYCIFLVYTRDLKQ